MLKPDVLCIGSATLDNFLTVEQPLSKIKLGDKVLVRHLEKHSGGGATNSAAALSKLGLQVRMLTKLGDDHDAEFILKEMKQYKVRNVCLHHSKKNTDFATLISSTKEKDRVIYVHKGASLDLSLNDFKKSQLKAKWVYLATLMGKSWKTAKEIVVNLKKTKLLFNPSLYLAKKGKSYLKPVLQKTTILVLNKEEAQALLKKRVADVKKLLLGLHQLGPETVVVTNGAKKMHALHENCFYSLTPPKVKVVHTAGAGDSFTAGLLAGIVKNYSFEDALRLGLVNSLSVIQHLGTKNKLFNEKRAKVLIKKHEIKVNKQILKKQSQK